MYVDMHEPEVIWRLGQWIAQRQSGDVRLTASGMDVILGLVDGKVVSISGLDSAEVSRALGVAPSGHDDLLKEAAALADAHELSQAQTVGAVKEILQAAIARWLVATDRDAEVRTAERSIDGGPTISMTHALVELLLSDPDGTLAAVVLPDLDVLLDRNENFLELYSPLRLSEDADLIAAKVTGQRTARDISSRSHSGAGDVVNLLAALVATGMIKPGPREATTEQPESVRYALPEPEVQRRNVPIWWLLAALAALLVIMVLLAAWWNRPPAQEAEVALVDGPEWTVVVDMGCEPQELQRILRKAGEHPDALKTVMADIGDGSRCWRLVWGNFPERAAAEAVISEIPEEFLMDGFEPHTIEVPADDSDSAPADIED